VYLLCSGAPFFWLDSLARTAVFFLDNNTGFRLPFARTSIFSLDSLALQFFGHPFHTHQFSGWIVCLELRFVLPAFMHIEFSSWIAYLELQFVIHSFLHINFLAGESTGGSRTTESPTRECECESFTDGNTIS